MTPAERNLNLEILKRIENCPMWIIIALDIRLEINLN
jgi:hypothetical protein